MDTVKSSSDLKLVWDFYDGDTRTMSIKNPKPNLTASQNKSVANLAKNTNVIIGDKYGANCVGLKSRAFHKFLSGNDIKEQFVIEKTG